MLINGNNNIITAPNIILERTSKRMSDFIDAADDSNNIKGNNNLLQAIRVFDNIMETNGVYPYILAFYPMIGGTAFSHKFNFMNPSLYPIFWDTGYVHSLAGVKSNGILGSISYIPINFTDLVYNNTHLLFGELESVLSQGVSVGFVDAGVTSVNRFLIHSRFTDGKNYSDHYSGTTNRMSYDNDPSLGVYLTQRSSATYAETRKNGIIQGTTLNTAVGNPTSQLRIANAYAINNNFYYNGLFSGIGVGSSMPNSQAFAYSNAVNIMLKICGKK